MRPKLLDGDAPEGIWDALVAQANTAGFDLVRKQRGDENGYCDFSHKQIAVRSDVSPGQAVKTLIHARPRAAAWRRPLEITRDRRGRSGIRPFIVLDAVGMVSDEYSFPYVARWSDGDVDLIRQCAERTVVCAGLILASLEGKG